MRYSVIDGAELRCPHCGEWWAILPEHWRINEWDMCLPCYREKARMYQAMRRIDPDFQDAEKRRSKRYRVWLKRVAPQYLAAYDREKRARRAQWQRDQRALKAG